MIHITLSPADELDRQLKDARITGYLRERQFIPNRRFRADFCWPADAIRLIVEVDGGTFARAGGKRCFLCGEIPKGRHSTGAGRERDCEKQALAIIAGLIYLGVYLRTLNLSLIAKNSRQGLAHPSLWQLLNQLLHQPPHPHHRAHHFAQFIFFTLISASATAFIASLYIRSNRLKQTALNAPQLPPQLKQMTALSNKALTSTLISPQSPILGESDTLDLKYYVVKVAFNKPTTIYQDPDETSPLVVSLKQSIVVSIKQEQGDWVKVEFADGEILKQGWIKRSLLTVDPTSK